MLTALVLAAEKSTAEEGRDIIIAMLLVGLVFVGVIAIGELRPLVPPPPRRGSLTPARGRPAR